MTRSLLLLLLLLLLVLQRRRRETIEARRRREKKGLDEMPVKWRESSLSGRRFKILSCIQKERSLPLGRMCQNKGPMCRVHSFLPVSYIIPRPFFSNVLHQPFFLRRRRPPWLVFTPFKRRSSHTARNNGTHQASGINYARPSPPEKWPSSEITASTWRRKKEKEKKEEESRARERFRSNLLIQSTLIKYLEKRDKNLWLERSLTEIVMHARGCSSRERKGEGRRRSVHNKSVETSSSASIRKK